MDIRLHMIADSKAYLRDGIVIKEIQCKVFNHLRKNSKTATHHHNRSIDVCHYHRIRFTVLQILKN